MQKVEYRIKQHERLKMLSPDTGYSKSLGIYIWNIAKMKKTAWCEISLPNKITHRNNRKLRSQNLPAYREQDF